MTRAEVFAKAVSAASYIQPVRVGEWAARYFMETERRDRPKWELAYLSRAQVFTTRLGLQAYSWGAGPVVLLIHGWDGRGTQMSSFVDSLVASGFRAVALDARGHGDSPGHSTHMLETAQAILDLTQELEGVHAMIGHSFGGGAIFYACKLGARPKAIVTLGTPCMISDVFRRYTDYLGLSRAAISVFVEVMEAKVGIKIDEARLDRIGRELKIPTLVFHDLKDSEVPFAEALKIINHRNEASLRTTLGLGHRRILKSKMVHQEVVEFIQTS